MALTHSGPDSEMPPGINERQRADMKHIIIGTAGHVDHGKTCLTKALTGINTDRLKEEQKRGITIENGFAQLTLPNGQEASIVDVPGHERFIRNMLVGASGMDVVLLVVAADEGFMPQTREHLGILSLLGVKSGIIVVTKIDMVEQEWLEAMLEEIRENVEGTFLENAPMIPVCAYTGQGIDELKAQIISLVDGAEEKSHIRPFRLPVDRVFTVDGFGTVVTGTLVEGTVKTGETVTIYPCGEKARIRGIQSHDRSIDQAAAGMRAALNLIGLDRHGIRRGDTVAKPDSMTLSSCLDVQIKMLNDAPFSLKSGTKVHFYHDTSELLCKARLLDTETLDAGQQGFAQLLFDQPLAVRNGDHFILRFFSPTVTIGGGVLLDVDAAPHKRRSEAVLDNLRTRASGSPEEVVLRVLEKGTALKHKELAQACALTEGELDAVLSPILDYGTVLKLGQRYLLLSSAEALWNDMRKMLKTYHQQYPLQVGMNLSELRSRLASKSPAYITDDLVSCFTRDGRLRLENSVVALPDFQADYTPESAVIRERVLALYDGYGFQPDTAELAETALGVDPKELSQVIARMRFDGELVSLSPQLLVDRAHYDLARHTMLDLFAQKPELGLTEFRDALGISLKFARAFLEHWDGIGITRRTEGNTRVLLKQK